MADCLEIVGVRTPQLRIDANEVTDQNPMLRPDGMQRVTAIRDSSYVE